MRTPTTPAPSDHSIDFCTDASLPGLYCAVMVYDSTVLVQGKQMRKEGLVLTCDGVRLYSAAVITEH